MYNRMQTAASINQSIKSHTHPHKLYTGSMFLQNLEEWNKSGKGLFRFDFF